MLLRCLSCDRELKNASPENLGDLSTSQGLLPFMEKFRAKAMANLQPTGPGLNAAELRKLNYITGDTVSSHKL